MTKNKQDNNDLDPLEESLASFACEGIHFTDKERALLRRMDAQGLSAEERMAQIDELLRQRR